MADPFLVKAVIGIGTVTVLLGLRYYLRGVTKQTQSSVEEADGQVVFSGSQQEANAALDALADAGVSAWLERNDEQWELHVDADQAEQVPMLLHAQAAMQMEAQEAQAEEPKEALSGQGAPHAF